MVTEAATIQAGIMDLPVKFPSETEVILDDVARFDGALTGGCRQGIPGSAGDRSRT